MQPDSQSVLALLRSLMHNPESRVLEHMICVGNAAARIAGALYDKGYELDVDKVRAMGYLHDVGRLVGPPDMHIINGYNYLKSQGFADDYCAICLVHSFPNGNPDCALSIPPNPKKDQLIFDFLAKHQLTLEEKIVTLCDLMCRYEVTTIDKRMIDVISRRDTWSGTQRCVLAVQELKTEFDNMLGYNLYKLFPEICDNL